MVPRAVADSLHIGNIEVYNIICDSLRIHPLPNNGTLRLPLKPIGLHSDEDVPGVDIIEDPPTSSIEPPSTTTFSFVSASTESAAAPDGSVEQANPEHDSWRNRLFDAFKKFEEWINELFG
jgi:hypothetical protein